MRKYLFDLAARGYDIKIVGHSLGAGTAALIAADLKNSFVALAQSLNDSYDDNDDNDGAGGTGAGGGGVNVDEGKTDSIGVDSKSATRSSAVSLSKRKYYMSAQRAVRNAMRTRGVVPSVSAISFAAPPVACEKLSTAFQRDKLVVSVVHSEDPISRFSRVNTFDLARRCKEFMSHAEKVNIIIGKFSFMSSDIAVISSLYLHHLFYSGNTRISQMLSGT
jgi:Lipase (class 3)